MKCRLARAAGILHGVSMSTAELLLQKASALPRELQQEALRYVDYLLEGRRGQ
jgi:hypothetical protein